MVGTIEHSDNQLIYNEVPDIRKQWPQPCATVPHRKLSWYDKLLLVTNSLNQNFWFVTQVFHCTCIYWCFWWCDCMYIVIHVLYCMYLCFYSTYVRIIYSMCVRMFIILTYMQYCTYITVCSFPAKNWRLWKWFVSNLIVVSAWLDWGITKSWLRLWKNYSKTSFPVIQRYVYLQFVLIWYCGHIGNPNSLRSST